MSVKEVLVAASELLCDEDHWMKWGRSVRGLERRELIARDARARGKRCPRGYCPITAIAEVCVEDERLSPSHHGALDALALALGTDRAGIILWNDAENRQFEEVTELFQRAIVSV